MSVTSVFQMEWFSLSPTDTEPVVFPDQGSLSSHRQHNDGTFSLSSHLVVPSTLTPGTKIICRVSHPALDAPVSVRTEVEGSEPGNWIYIYPQHVYDCRQRNHGNYFVAQSEWHKQSSPGKVNDSEPFFSPAPSLTEHKTAKSPSTGHTWAWFSLFYLNL